MTIWPGMAIKPEIWAAARVMFEGGKVPQDIADKLGIDRSTIAKKAKNDDWKKGKNHSLIVDEARVVAEKSQLNSQELGFHNREVERLTEDAKMIHTLTKNNMVGVGNKLRNHQSLNMNDHKAAQDLIDKASITLGVNERFAKPANIQQNTQNKMTEIIFTRATVAG